MSALLLLRCSPPWLHSLRFSARRPAAEDLDDAYIALPIHIYARGYIPPGPESGEAGRKLGPNPRISTIFRPPKMAKLGPPPPISSCLFAKSVLGGYYSLVGTGISPPQFPDQPPRSA
ncbi:hypothetical protein BD414DRAFT_509834 [Trametes punicea]|nr:hypothetical protein BD414DRAFT_509834 [Trametes punicea]